MVMKVKKNNEKIKMTLPPDSQNSASPYAPTARMLMALRDELVHVLDGINRDPEAYSNADEFDGLRFYNLRNKPSKLTIDDGEAGHSEETKLGFVTASPENPNPHTSIACHGHRRW